MLDGAGAKEQAKVDDLSLTRSDDQRGMNETFVHQKLGHVPLSRVASNYAEMLTENVRHSRYGVLSHPASEDSANNVGPRVTH